MDIACCGQHALSARAGKEVADAAAVMGAGGGARLPDRPEAPANAGEWTRMADRFVQALVSGDVAELARLYHPRLRFAVRTMGAVFGRDGALANFGRM